MSTAMSVWAIIPVKQLTESKRRLSHLLSAADRADLIATFLDHLLTTLSETSVDRTLLVTGDGRAAAIAAHHGAEVLTEDQPYDLNSAVAQARDYALGRGATAVLVLPADLPFARAEDIEAMLRPLGEGRGALAAVCSDETGDGTNALLLAPPGDFTFRYGPGSAGRHAAEAARRGRVCRLIRAPGLRFDLDTESDWLVYNGYYVQVADE
jgi:2-phospho-L-lactate guanylyltransferase